MKLGTKGRYAVMAMVDLAKFAQDKPIPLSLIAERQEISLSYLEQLLNKLRHHGLVKSARGAAGGYVLSRPSHTIPILEIILAADEPIKATRCKNQLSPGCLSLNTKCLVHDLWEGLGNHIKDYLQNISLEDVIHKKIMLPQNNISQKEEIESINHVFAEDLISREANYE